ncbi:hypothetical protein [Halorhabdus salina]|uniref:hypothetical protein n=1 Tax=Halorhabdus salina TaxID=2750670 RepID=UPI0015EF56B9|nr:hypothetical protein [Halorhabdus salina]
MTPRSSWAAFPTDPRRLVRVRRYFEPEIVTSWRDGRLADLALPVWIDDVIAQLQRAA